MTNLFEFQAGLRIVYYPNPVLLQQARIVPAADLQTAAVADRMLELMYEAKGIGLAAPQVGLPWRMFVIDLPEDEEQTRSAGGEHPSATDGPMVFIDPVLSNPQGELEPHEEGCLSMPPIRGTVKRFPKITVTARNLGGKPFTLTATGLLARCIQHEFDHLEGVLIISKMSQMARLKPFIHIAIQYRTKT